MILKADMTEIRFSQVLSFTLPGNGSLPGGHQNVTLTAKDARVIYLLVLTIQGYVENK